MKNNRLFVDLCYTETIKNFLKFVGCRANFTVRHLSMNFDAFCIYHEELWWFCSRYRVGPFLLPHRSTTHSPYSREEAACWNVASCSWEGGDTGWVHTSAPGCRGQDASSLGSLVFVSLATMRLLLSSYPLPTPILLPNPNCRASSSGNSLFRQTLVSSLIVSRHHWMFWKKRRKDATF